MRFIITKAFLVLGLALLIVPRLAFAFAPFDSSVTDDMNRYGKDLIDKNFNSATDGNSINVIVGQVLNVFFGLSATIFLVLCVLAGYNWMTSSGEEKKVTKAQNMLKYAVIGLAVMLAAYIITYFVFLAIPEGA